MTENTLRLNKANTTRGSNHGETRSRLHPLTGKHAIVQTKSPSQITGFVESFDNGWLIVEGSERRWLSNGDLSDVVCSGRFTIERSAINFICKVQS